MIETKYSHDEYSVVAVYDLDANGNLILDAPRYAVVGPTGFYSVVYGSLPAAFAAMEQIISQGRNLLLNSAGGRYRIIQHIVKMAFG